MGAAKSGSDVVTAVYSVNVKTGETKLLDQADADTNIWSLLPTQTVEGPVLFYNKHIISSGFNALFVSDPAWPKPLQLTNFGPSLYNGALIWNMMDDKMFATPFISYDRKVAMVGVIDELQSNNPCGDDPYCDPEPPQAWANYYRRDISELFASQAGTTTEEEKAAKNAAKTTGATKGTAKEGTETTAAPDTIAPAPETSPLGDGWVLAHPKIDKSSVVSTLWAKIDDKLIWESNHDQFKYLYWNTTTDSTMNRITKQDVTSDEILSGIVMKVAKSTPPESAVSFDLADDIDAKLACGSETAHAYYCADPRQMCIDKKCVDMFTCSATVPKGVCADSSKICKDGSCVAGGGGEQYLCPNGNGDCVVYEKCDAGYCVSAPDQECQVAMQCLNSRGGTVNSWECTANKCVPKAAACADSKTCEKYHKCTNSSCVDDAVHECQVSEQCGNVNSYSCNSYWCTLRVLNLTLTATNKGIVAPGTCAHHKCTTQYNYEFKVTWTFNGVGREQEFYRTLHTPTAANSGLTTCTSGSPCTYTSNQVVTFTRAEQPVNSAWSQPKYSIGVKPRDSKPGVAPAVKEVTLTKPAPVAPYTN
jgi:hypothetical protein